MSLPIDRCGGDFRSDIKLTENDSPRFLEALSAHLLPLESAMEFSRVAAEAKGSGQPPEHPFRLFAPPARRK